MAAVKTLINDSTARAVMLITSDVTTAVTIDVSAELSGAPAEVVIERIIFAGDGVGVDVMWDATTDVLAWVCPPVYADMDFNTSIGGLRNTSGAGKTGDIILNTNAFAAGDTYSLVLYMRKV